jgi:hypothetical protein
MVLSASDPGRRLQVIQTRKKTMKVILALVITATFTLPVYAQSSVSPYKGGYDGGQKGAMCQQRAGFTQAQYMAKQTTRAQRAAWSRCMKS